MFTTRVRSKDTEERLDARYYRPSFIQVKIDLEQLNAVPLDEVVSKVECGPFGGNAIADGLYEPQGLPFIRPVNLSGNVLDCANLVRVSENRLRKYGLKTYDGVNLCFSRVGDPCVVAVAGRLSISPNVIIAISDGDAGDVHYLHAFCSSRFGLLQLARSLKEGVQPTTSTDAIRSMLVLKPENPVQTYIGDKVRQAERLRERAREMYGSVDQLFTSADLVSEDPITRYERVGTSLLNNRLDHLHYRSDLLANHLRLAKYDLALLGDKDHFQGLRDGEHGNPVYGNGPLYVRASEMGRNLFDESACARLDPAYARGVSSSCWAQPGDVVFSIVGTLGLTAVITEPHRAIMSRGVAKVTPTKLPPFYVKAYMRSMSFGKQLTRASVGTVQRGVYLESLAGVGIPLLDGATIAAIANREESADLASLLASSLTTAAKLLVEALIEGKVTESELKSAQEALERGDNSEDRAILSRLTRKGMDAPREPKLFADIDKLYAILTETRTDDNNTQDN